MDKSNNKEYGYLLQDDSCHWYLVPECLVYRFKELIDKMAEISDECVGYSEECLEFIDLFMEHMINRPQDVRILLED